MTIWKPNPHIRVKVLGLAWRGDRLLAAPIGNSSGRVIGVRPLGGCIEFGETREDALRREFQEELGCGAAIAGPWHLFENIFEHEGNIGHEFVFAANIELSDGSFYGRDSVAYLEDDGAACSASWFSPLDLPAGVELYPRGLQALIQAGEISPRG